MANAEGDGVENEGGDEGQSPESSEANPNISSNYIALTATIIGLVAP